MPLHFEELTTTNIDSLSREQTVFFFPVGPLEDHGPHLPIGLDLMEARKTSLLTAKRLEHELPGWTGIIMPNAPLGIDSNTTKLAITVRGHVLRDWLVDACRSLHRSGFKHFVCFSGHLGPKQLTAIEEAGRMLRKNRKLMFLWPFMKPRGPILVSANSALIDKAAVHANALWPDPGEHAGQRDTSIALALAPQLVDKNWNSLPKKPRETPRLKRFFLRLSRRRCGYWGSPAEAHPDTGANILNTTVNDVFLKLRAAWEGANPEGLFRSWYSLFPTNKSFFKAWVAIIMLTILLAVWVYTVSEALSPL